MTHIQLASAAGINRSMLSKSESAVYTPSIAQAETLASVLRFDLSDYFLPDTVMPAPQKRTLRIP
ncbi:MAG: helix-turn-helix transcriptional regulator [Clostridia bacterium]|nr:helix-turn-helix transcriptional regulator [Clostridia bacterium]